jgi:hypothetical protein
MELAVFTARIDAGRQCLQESRVERTARKRPLEAVWVHARQSRLQATGDHLSRERSGCLRLPEREQGRKSGSRQTVLTVATHVFQEQVAERHVREPRTDEAGDGHGHTLLILLVGARPRERHDRERQTRGVCLGVEQLAPNGMHRHSVERPVSSRQQACNGFRMLPL